MVFSRNEICYFPSCFARRGIIRKKTIKYNQILNQQTYRCNFSVDSFRCSWCSCNASWSSCKASKVAGQTAGDVHIKLAVDRYQCADGWTNTFWRNARIGLVDPRWPDTVWSCLEIIQWICCDIWRDKIWKNDESFKLKKML